MQFNNDLLDQYFAPGISTFREADIPHLDGKTSEAPHWLSNHFLNSILGNRYKPLWRQLAVIFLFRSQCAVQGYLDARSKTLEFFEKSSDGRPATGLYFRALADWEKVILNLQIALDVFTKVIPSHDPGEDGESLRRMANRIKHVGEDMVTDKHPESLTVPLWMTREGLETRTAKLSYSQIAENLMEMGAACDILALPAASPLEPSE